jgi:hypothetical protein
MKNVVGMYNENVGTYVPTSAGGFFVPKLCS